MFKIQTLNKIDPDGLKLFPLDQYEIASEIPNPDAIVLRSFKMHDMELPSSLKAVARAGAGVNNIPVDKCTEKGIVVFNTPGANANGVKEAVIAGMLMASRDYIGAVNWAKTLIGEGDNVGALVEKGKNNFAAKRSKKDTGCYRSGSHWCAGGQRCIGTADESDRLRPLHVGKTRAETKPRSYLGGRHSGAFIASRFCNH